MTIDVLDHGYVRLRDRMGDDLSVVNAARVSFDKRAERDAQGMVRKRDQRLLAFLAREGHKLPFAHAFLTFEIYAPVMVMRQWYKHRVGSSYTEMPEDVIESHNESSRRYITEDNTYYLPQVWRSAPENRKQGSGEPLSVRKAAKLTMMLDQIQGEGQARYEQALEMGVAPEQARLFLPYAGLYVRFIWSCSLLRVLEYLKLRRADDAQAEIRAYADAIHQLTQPHFPLAFAAWFPENL